MRDSSRTTHGQQNRRCSKTVHGAGLFSASPIILISNLLDLYSIADIIADYYDTAVNTEKAGMVHKIFFSAAVITAVLPVIWHVTTYPISLSAWSCYKISGR
jgi:hypothetical protein